MGSNDALLMDEEFIILPRAETHNMSLINITVIGFYHLIVYTIFEIKTFFSGQWWEHMYIYRFCTWLQLLINIEFSIDNSLENSAEL